MGRLLGLSLFFLVAQGRLAYAVDVSFEDLAAGYSQNIQALGVFRCDVEREISLTDEHFDVLQHYIARLEQATKRELSVESRGLVEKELAKIRGQLKTKSLYPERSTAAFTVGARSFQVAVPHSGLLPPVPLENQSDFIGKCSGSVVLSWSTDQNPPAWLWQGLSRRGDGVYHATVSSQRPQEFLSFPPIPIGDRGKVFYEQDLLSPFDAFFEDDFEETSIIGNEEFEGSDTIVVTRQKDNGGSKFLYKAWLAIDRGFLPVRIERKLCGKDVAFEDVQPGELITVSSFHDAGNGAFYPDRWTTESKADDNRDGAPRGSRARHSALYTYRTEKWKVERFLANQQEPVLFSHLGFPDGTLCLNENTKTFSTIGKPEKIVNAMLDNSPKPEVAKSQNPGLGKRPNTRWSRVFWVNLLVVVGAVLFAVRRRAVAARRN